MGNEYLRYGRFKWLKNIDGFDVNLISEKSPIRYFLEVDLEYPDELHELHNDYPLAPEKLAASGDMILTYEIKSENVYENFFRWKNMFDFSNFPKDSNFFDGTNKKFLEK